MSGPERCPCCDGLVGSNTYELAVVRPPVVALHRVCRACELVLCGDDLAAHDALVIAAARQIDGGLNALTLQ